MYAQFVTLVREIYHTDAFVPLHAPQFSATDKELVERAIESTYVSTVGEYVGEFEDQLRTVTGAEYVIATNSGTSALHLCLLACDVGAGDEVITTPLSFVATSNSIRYCSAEPVFVDVEAEALGMCPESLREFLEQHCEIRDDGLCWNRISGRIVRACMPVHCLGHPARVEELKRICDYYRINLIEDAAAGLGSRIGNVSVGLEGVTGAFSFNGNKIITTGGGGAVVTARKDLADRIRHLSSTAKVSHPWLFAHDFVGYNYRLPNLNAALGLAQLKKLTAYIEKKRMLADCYRDWFQSYGLQTITERNGVNSNYWLNAVVMDDLHQRDAFLEYTNSHEVSTRPFWALLHTLPMFRDCLRTNLVTAESIAQRKVNVPRSPQP